MKVTFSFIFSRKSLFEIKCLPCCPFTKWAYSSVKCHCDCRLGVFNLLIDDWIKFQSYDNDFDPPSCLVSRLKFFHLFLFSSPPEAWNFMFHFYIPAIDGFSASIAMKFFFFWPCSFMWRFKASSRPYFSKHRAFYLFILLWWRRCFIWCYLNKQKKAALRIASQIIYYYLNVI